MKKSFTVMLALMLVLAMSATAFAAPSNWAAEEVNQAIALELVPEELQADYQDPITREDFCELIMSLADHFEGESIAPDADVVFTDTENESVLEAVGLGIVGGRGGGIFDPESPIAREEAAAMLERAARVFGVTVTNASSVIFSDADQISAWAANAVNFVATNGIMGGVGDNMFNPKGTYTVEQSILTVLRLYNLLSGVAAAVEVPAEIQAVIDEVIALAHSFAVQLDGAWGDLHVALMESGEEAEFESFEEMKAVLDGFRVESGAYYVYAFYPSGDPASSAYIITVDGSEDPDEFGTEYDFEIQFIEAWSGTPAAARSSWNNDGPEDPVWSAFAPVHDSEGNVVALVGVDYPAPVVVDFQEWSRDSEEWNGIEH